MLRSDEEADVALIEVQCDPDCLTLSLGSANDVTEAVSEGDPSEQMDWEGAENPCRDSKKSSQAPVWGELDPEEEAGQRRVKVPVGLIDGDWS